MNWVAVGRGPLASLDGATEVGGIARAAAPPTTVPRESGRRPGVLAAGDPRAAAGEGVLFGVCARAIWSSATRFPLRLLDLGGSRGFPIRRPLAIHRLGHQRSGRCAVQAGAVLTGTVFAYSVAWAASFQIFVACVLPDVPWLGCCPLPLLGLPPVGARLQPRFDRGPDRGARHPDVGQIGTVIVSCCLRAANVLRGRARVIGRQRIGLLGDEPLLVRTWTVVKQAQ